MICCTYFSTSTFAVNWIFHDSILPCKRMLEIGPALVNEAFDVKFCICVGGNFRTFIFYRQTCASIFMVPWRFSVGFTALVWECFLRIWDLSEAAPDADVAREMWLFIPKDRWVQVPRRIEVENVSSKHQESALRNCKTWRVEILDTSYLASASPHCEGSFIHNIFVDVTHWLPFLQS